MGEFGAGGGTFDGIDGKLRRARPGMSLPILDGSDDGVDGRACEHALRLEYLFLPLFRGPLVRGKSQVNHEYTLFKLIAL
jgi:hypothetical protein